jgi:hypothetical protein
MPGSYLYEGVFRIIYLSLCSLLNSKFLVQFITRAVYVSGRNFGGFLQKIREKVIFFFFSQMTSRKYQNKCKSSYNSHYGYFCDEVSMRENIVLLQLEPRDAHNISKISLIISNFLFTNECTSDCLKTILKFTLK